MDSLRKIKDGHIFNAPVDPVQLRLPTYFDVIKKPMDFGTIKKKISLNMYKSPNDWVEDVSLVFENCRKFNGVDTYVGKIGVVMKMEF